MCYLTTELPGIKPQNRQFKTSGVTNHRQPRQCRGAQEAQNVDLNWHWRFKGGLRPVANVCRGGGKNYSYATVYLPNQYTTRPHSDTRLRVVSYWLFGSLVFWYAWALMMRSMLPDQPNWLATRAHGDVVRRSVITAFSIWPVHITPLIQPILLNTSPYQGTFTPFSAMTLLTGHQEERIRNRLIKYDTSKLLRLQDNVAAK